MQRRKISTVCSLVRHKSKHGVKQMCLISTTAKQEKSLMSSKDHVSGFETFKEQDMHWGSQSVFFWRKGYMKWVGKRGSIWKLWKTTNLNICKRMPQKIKEQTYPHAHIHQGTENDFAFDHLRSLAHVTRHCPPTRNFSSLKSSFVFQTRSPTCQF